MEVAGAELSCDEDGEAVGSVVGVACVVEGVAWTVEGEVSLEVGAGCSAVGVSTWLWGGSV